MFHMTGHLRENTDAYIKASGVIKERPTTEQYMLHAIQPRYLTTLIAHHDMISVDQLVS